MAKRNSLHAHLTTVPDEGLSTAPGHQIKRVKIRALLCNAIMALAGKFEQRIRKSRWHLPFLIFATLNPPVAAQGLYYKIETVAETTNFTSVGETIESFRSTSINESGIVAMAAIVDDGGPQTKQGLYLSGASNVPVALGISADNRRTGFANINAAGQVCAWEGYLTGNPRQSLIRIWDASNPNTIPTPLIRNTQSGLDAILTPPSIANDGTVMFPAFAPRRLYLNSLGIQNTKLDVGSIAPNGQPWVADGGAYVLREGQTTGGLLSFSSAAGPRRTIAQAGAGFIQIGNLPGISNSGKVVAFSGEDASDGEGIFLYINEPSDPDFSAPVRLLGFEEGQDGLGVDDSDQVITFESFDFVHRVGVEHRAAGPAGIEGDSIIVSFIATPESASVTNPHTGDPLLFTKNPALWVVHVTPSRDFDGTTAIRLDVKTSPMPVVQVGQRIGSRTITDLATYDPIAFAEKTTSGFQRVTIGPADHYVTCEATLADGTVSVLRATQLDSDNDGLYDHWEQPSGGIDVDLDGIVDLRLSDFGADPNRKDAFFEIDWSKEWRPETFTDTNQNGVYNLGEPFSDLDGNTVYTVGRYVPDPAALQKIATQMANAPVPNPVGPDGITAHIDAGIARSINLPATAQTAGGDLIARPGDNAFIHIVFADPEVYVPVNPNNVILPYGETPVEVWVGDITRRYFGNLEKNAREFAFRHITFAAQVGIEKAGDTTGLAESPTFALRSLSPKEEYNDDDHNCRYSHGDPFVDTNGNNILDQAEQFFDLGPAGYDQPEPFTDLNGNGRWDGAVFESFRSFPGNSIIMGLEGIDSRLTQSGKIRVLFPNPNVPAEITPPPGFFHFQVLFHEIGHTFTLNHGGSDGATSRHRPTIKPLYRSLMNYAYTELPDSNGVIIDNYSNMSGPGTFNDWAIFQMDFNRYFDTLGTFQLASRFASGTPEGTKTETTPHRTIAGLENLLGPLSPIERPLAEIGENAFPLDLTDNDRDGLQYLIEIAIGLNPDLADSQNSPLRFGLEGSGDSAVYFFIYPRDSSLGIDYRVEYSEDLINWRMDQLSESTLETNGTIQTQKATLPISTGPKIYFRLVVSRSQD